MLPLDWRSLGWKTVDNGTSEVLLFRFGAPESENCLPISLESLKGKGKDCASPSLGLPKAGTVLPLEEGIHSCDLWSGN